MARNRLLARNGFTLMEVLIVMTIALVMLGMAVPMIQSADSVSSEVRRFVADLTRGRSWARTTWRETTIDVDTVNRRWRIIDETGETLDGASADDNGWRTLREGVIFYTDDGASNDFGFKPDGSSTSSASVLLRGGDSTWRVSSSALSGTISAESVEDDE